MIDIKPPDNRPIDGVSILPFLKGKVEKRNQSIYWGYNIGGKFNGSYNVSTSGDQYKLMIAYNKGKIENVELFDLLADVDEKVNLAGEKSYSDIIHHMMNEIEAWRESVINSANTVGCLNEKDMLEIL